jgi:hypothetical protein
MKSVKLVVAYDEEAGVYFVRESNLSGLLAEAASLEMLRRRLVWAARDLIAENHLDVPCEIPIELTVEDADARTGGSREYRERA